MNTTNPSLVYKFKASHAQQRIWFIDKLHGESQEYNIPKVVRLTGHLDLGALQQALDDVVSRHEVLRTWFEFKDERLHQMTIEHYSCKIDLEQAEGSERDTVAPFIAKTCRHQFDLTQLPLFKLSVLELNENQYILAIVFHHIISDGWSSDIFMQELKHCYAKRLQSLSPTLPPITLQYADFAEWQKDQLEQHPDLYDKALDAQQQELQKAETLNIPSDHTRPKQRSNKGGLVKTILPNTDRLKLESTSSLLNVSPFTILMAAWQVLLSRYSRQQHFAVGFPAACRESTELESVLGLFINTTVTAANVDMSMTAKSHILAVHDAILTALEYQSLPLDLLVDRMSPDRDLAIHPIFQVMLSYHKSSNIISDWPNGSLEIMPSVNNTSKFDATLTVEHSEAELALIIEYSTDLFKPETMKNMVASLSHLLADMLNNLSRPLAQCQMCSPKKKVVSLEEYSHKPLDMFPANNLIDAFEDIVKCHPFRTAVSLGETQVDYQSLQQKVDCIAASIILASHSNNSDKPIVAACMVPSIELVATLIAIMKTGAAYLVLDPTQPVSRLQYFIKDASVNLVVNHKQTQEVCQQLLLEKEFKILPIEPALHNKNIDANPVTTLCHQDSLAYVIYTSGSTGEPKGVEIPHSNVMRLFSSTSKWFQFNEQDCWTLFHSTAFDFSVWEMWGALLHGGQLVIVDKDTTRDPDAFYQLVENKAVTILNQTPSAFNNFIKQDSKQKGNLSLRYVIFGGEALDFDRLGNWYQRHDDHAPQLINMYGITETTVHVTYMPLNRELVASNSASLIGEAIPDLDIYLLDEHKNLVPDGMVGEIFVGGAGLATGYLNREELTSERFVNITLTDNLSQRLYKTGDLARFNADNCLEYIGRCDSQVKIRGYRIETGEIEAVIRSVLNIDEVKVVAHSATGGGAKQLFAYLVSSTEDIEQDVLIEQLQQSLPDYMIPTAFFPINKLPLTVNGKLDFANLPLPQGLRPRLRNQYLAPKTKPQKILCEIWQAVLSVDTVGINDNFFALGGDSLRAVQATERAKTAGLCHSLIGLFQYQTVAKLTVNLNQVDDSFDYIETPHFSQITSHDKSLLPADIVDAYPLSAMQASMFYHMALSPESNVYHCTGTTNFTIGATFDKKAFYAAVQETVNSHDVYKTSFDFDTYSEPLQLVHQTAILPTEIVDISHLSKEQQDECIFSLLDKEKRTPFDLSKPTLLRYFIHLRTPRSFQFTMTECHPVFDGWSYHSMIVEVFNRYASKLKNIDYVAMDQGRYRYADFVALEKRIVQDDKQKEFWQSLLSDFTVTRLPRLIEQDKNKKIPDLRLKRLTLTGQLYHKLKLLCQRAEVPMKSVALAAHVKVLSLVCGENDILTGIPANGRPENSAGDKLSGLFLNTLPFRFKLKPVSWEQMVRDIFLVETSMLPYRRYPFSSIQKDCGGQQIMDEVLFNYLDFHIYDELDTILKLKASNPLEKDEINEGTNFALTVHFQHLTLTSNLQRNQVSVDIDYDANKLSFAQANMLESLYYEVLKDMAETPTQIHSEVAFSQRIEKESITPVQDLTIQADNSHGLAFVFKNSVIKNSQAIAISDGSQKITYGQLNESANRLAHFLLEKGVKRFDKIAVMLPRSSIFIEVILALIKLGACYVPINPSDPEQRKQQLLCTADASLLITGQEQLSSNSEDRCLGLNTLNIDEYHRDEGVYSNQDPQTTSTTSDTAYIMFTSGSTGEPKGVEVMQSNILSLVKNQNYVNIDANTVISHLSSVAFDASTFEIWGALLNGACIAMHTQQIPTVSSLQNLIQTQGVNLSVLTTSLFNTLIDEDPTSMRGIKQLMVGGETFSSKHAQACLDESPELNLINIYGPTEATTYALFYQVPQDLSVFYTTVPIGKPLNGVSAFVLDRHLIPVPLGTPGELYIGGNGVSKGYINNTELTRKCFVNAPKIKQQRLYKTGDKVRMLPNGNIEYLDRFDSQVKIRGFRVDLNEIEAGLRSFDGVKDACTVIQGEKADKKIVAYWIPEKKVDTPTDSDVREQLKQLMPTYMIPNHFHCLESFPLTLNGKIDKKRLINLDIHPLADVEAVQPSTDDERKILAVWNEVLKKEQISIDDHFFEIGGHSLLLIKVHGLLKKAGFTRLTLVDLLRFPSIRMLCAFLNTSHIDTQNITSNKIKSNSSQLNAFRKRKVERKHKPINIGIN
ncbi:amino acid adenylation domain-containing protein [Paraglaciecola sp.]|uniref:amino acid adenylation domain-containing protein n=1 Tax=Paraglaciecola sp. TaxID=1920173 RepID=UPI0030F39F1C